MKTLTVIIALILLSGVAGAEVGQDKYKHAAGCAAISGLTETILQETTELSKFQRVVIAALVTMGIGVGKELTDDHVDNEDIIADGIGAILGLSFTWNF